MSTAPQQKEGDVLVRVIMMKAVSQQQNASVIRIAAVVIADDKGRVLSVRKAGTEAFMMPGGKLEPGEKPVETAVRELAEELHLTVERDTLLPVGRFSADAANEKGFRVDCDVFLWPERLNEVPSTHAEIVEACFTDPRNPGDNCAPLSCDVVFPYILAHGYLDEKYDTEGRTRRPE